MNRRDTYIMELLTAAIFADKQILSAEIKAFVKAIKTLQEQCVLEINLTEAKIILWYENHKDQLREFKSAQAFDQWLSERLAVLIHPHEKNAVLKAIEDISLSDEELHVSERALITLISKRLSTHSKYS